MSEAKKQTWANLTRSDQAIEAENKGPSAWEKTAAALGGVAAAGAEFTGNAVRSGLDEFVSRALLGDEKYSAPQPGEKEAEQGKEQDKDQEIER